VYVAEGAKEFASRLAEALAETDPALRDRRVETAKAEAWAKRAESLIAISRRVFPVARSTSVTASDLNRGCLRLTS
jgi:hypothetical protein